VTNNKEKNAIDAIEIGIVQAVDTDGVLRAGVSIRVQSPDAKKPRAILPLAEARAIGHAMIALADALAARPTFVPNTAQTEERS
jgi:hypothetical protein